MKNYLQFSLRGLFLSLAVLLSLPMLAAKVEIDGINYDLVAKLKQATVIAKSSGEYSGEVVIPESVEYGGTAYRVTSIGSSAFESCKGLTSVTIPNSVTSIGKEAFSCCSGLTSVTIGNSVTSIGDRAFEYCSGLTSVTIPNSVTSIGDGAFESCKGLTSVTIPNSVTSIGGYAFSACSGLTSVAIGNSVTSIGDLAFSYCSKLLDVYCYAEKVPSYERFNGYYLKNATLHVPAASLDSYRATAPWSWFGKIVAITEVDGINYDFDAETKKATVIEKRSGKYSGEVVIPESVEYEGAAYSVTSIGDGAFDGCSGLTSVTIGNSVTSIGYGAFNGCFGLTSVHISDIAAWCNIDFDSSFSNPLPYANHLYLNGEEVKDLVIPNSVTSIGEGTFWGCSGLTSVTIPNSVTSIGGYAFSSCSGLTSVTIGNSVTSIGYGAFDGCSGLTSVTIGNSVTSIEDGAFDGCSGLTSVHISDIAAWCNIYFETAGSNPLCYANHLYLNGEEVKDLVIPNSVTSIGDRAFYECYGLTSVTIPNSVTSIGDYAFEGCYRLTSVTIPNSVTSIGEGTFRVCYGLTSVTIGNSVKSIGYDAFAGCRGLTSVTIPNSVTSIGDCAFHSCDDLTSVTIPNSVESIGAGAFSGCSDLTSVTIGNSVKSIGSGAFSACFVLSSVTIGNSVTSIGTRAFMGCSKLLDVYCYAEKVPSTGYGVFESSYPEYVTLHVPAASVDSYKASYLWSSFGKIVALTPEETGIDELKGENGTENSAVFDLSGRRVQKGQKGIFIQNGKKVMVK